MRSKDVLSLWLPVLAHALKPATSNQNGPPLPTSSEIEAQTYRTSFTIDLTKTLQTIDGFGFCEAFQRAHSIINLPQTYQKEVLDLLFNTTTGAGFSILRLGLGSSTNSTLDHMNSPQPKEDGPFAWDHKDSGQVRVAKQAQQYGVSTFYADAWSAPGYMKTNGRDDQGGWLCGVNGEGSANGTSCGAPPASFIQAYAQYLAQYVKAYIDEGIPIQHVGFLNEPNLIKSYATMQSTGSQAADVIGPLSLALAGIGLPDVGISCCEGQGWSYTRDLLFELHTADASAEDKLSVITTHTYKGTPPGPDRPLNTTLPVWVTEISPIMQRLGMSQTWYRNHTENEGLLGAINIYEALTTGNVSAYIYWIGVGQGKGDAPFIWAPNGNSTREGMWGVAGGGGVEVERAGNEAVPYTIGSTYWAAAHFSRFIRPGAKRADHWQGLEGNPMHGVVLFSAYVNVDGSVVVQAINNSDVEVAELGVKILWGEVGTKFGGGHTRGCRVDTWVTDNERRFVALGLGEKVSKEGTFLGDLPPRSLTTYVVRCGRD